MIEEEKNSGPTLELSEKIVQIRRVTKVVTGGKRMGFRAVVVVGDKVSRVGLGIGKAAEVSAAIRKGGEKAKKNLIYVENKEGTIPHDVMGYFGASQVVLRSARRGTGVIAGGAVRVVLESAGLKNIVAKSIGSNNPINSARATMAALQSLKTPEQLAMRRGKNNVKA